MREGIFLINPPTAVDGINLYFPMGLLCVGSFLKLHGHSVHLLDFDLDLRNRPSLKNWKEFRSHFLEKLSDSKDKVFGISSICSNFPVAVQMAREIKQQWPESLIIMGGPQPSSIPKQLLESIPWVDVVVIGEGEHTLFDLAEKKWNSSFFKNIPGLAYRSETGKVLLSEHRPLISNLDTLPYPDFSMIHLKDYLESTSYIHLVEAGRGCPFTCSFCSTAVMWERKYRIKSPARILEEMERLFEHYGMRRFVFTHDNFTTSRKFVQNFCEYMTENNRHHLSWLATARTDTVDEELLAQMAKAGCHALYFGVDTGSSQMQRIITKDLDLEEYRHIQKLAAKNNILSTASYVVGYPEESEEDLNDTFELALWGRMNGASDVQFHRLSPLSGTQIYRQNVANLYLDDTSSDISLVSLNSPEILRLIKEYPTVFSSFYSIPTPKLREIDLTCAIVFFEEMINHHAQTLSRLLNSVRSRPLDLYKSWLKWKQSRFPEKILEGAFIGNTLAQFIKESLYSSLKIFPAIQTAICRNPAVFLGPSLDIKTAKSILDADYYSPIRRGDLTRLVQQGYQTIGIIDGTFHQNLTVSIHEIRNALEKGVKIFGSSSMGALRAAETHPLGMVGIGRIFQHYQSGLIDADDEVAICFDPETGKALTEPLINIRATLERIHQLEEIPYNYLEWLWKEARETHYTQRHWKNLFQAAQQEFGPEEAFNLERACRKNYINIKGEDAILLLENISQYASARHSPKLSHRMASFA